MDLQKTTWKPRAYQALLEENYQQITLIYQEAIAHEPEEISHYWYLSLSYLLQEQEEEAQGVWLSVFTEVEEDNLEEWTASLVKILDQEALRQAMDKKNYHLAWLLRLHIQEIEPTFINNLLDLIQLEIILEHYQPDSLKQWQVIELVKNSHPGDLDHKLLGEVVIKAAPFISDISVEFAEAGLEIVTDKLALIKELINIANNIAFDQKVSLYAIDLTKVCRKFLPNNLWLIKELFWFYAIIRYFDEALELAKLFCEKSTNKVEQANGNYKLLYIHMLRADWLKVIPIIERHKQLIYSMSLEDQHQVDDYLGSSLISITQCLLYFEDNPQENRPLQNYIAKLFQESVLKGAPVVSVPAQLKTEKLRIGYIGHTIRRHSVGWLSRWLFQHHNKENFEIALYLLNQEEDYITEQWFKPKADLFYNFQRDTNSLIKQIQKDGINILVDLDSITLSLTCQVLAAKPAPVQVTWLGLDASGLPAIDYFIGDPYVLPENAQSYYHEKIWRLPKTYLAIDGFEVGVPNRRREDLDIPLDATIYLNMQGALKRHPRNIQMQMRILKAVHNSYLIVKGNADQKVTEELYTHIANEEGVSLEKLRFLPQDETEEIHRANLTMADVVLDTYPYNGATTTLEVLWMGVPLVTRVGQQFAARNSYTFMVNAGLSEGIAYTDEEYFQWGVKYGRDPALRERVAAKLRASRQTSPLWNAKEFTQEMEKAYEQMWAIYRDQGIKE